MKKWWKHLLHFSQFFPGIFNFTVGIRGRGLEHAILDGPGFWSSLSNSGPSPDGQTCKMVCFEFPNVFRRYRAGSDDFLKMTRFEFPARSSQNDCFFSKTDFFQAGVVMRRPDWRLDQMTRGFRLKFSWNKPKPSHKNDRGELFEDVFYTSILNPNHKWSSGRRTPLYLEYFRSYY